MRTGQHLKVKKMGDKVMGVALEGNPSKPEPIYFRITLPSGDVDIVRCQDNSYWVHVRVNHKDKDIGSVDANQYGEFIDGRIDLTDRHASECNQGDFGHPKMYHMAVKIARKEGV